MGFLFLVARMTSAELSQDTPENVQLILTLIGLLFLSEPSLFNACLTETAALQYPSGTISRMTFGR